MKIAVCFKVVTDFDQVPSEIWKGPRSRDFKYVKKGFGFFDEGALEAALRVKDNLPDTYVEAITLGEEDSYFTELLYAAGFNHVEYLNGKSSEFSSMDTAKALAWYLEARKFDLILTGEMVGPNDTGSVPYYLAKYLYLGIIDRITDVYAKDGQVIIERETDAKNEKYWLMPGKSDEVLGIVSNSKHPYLRWSTFRAREIAKGMKGESIPVQIKFEPAKLKLVEAKGREVKVEFIDSEKLIEFLREDGD